MECWQSAHVSRDKFESAFGDVLKPQCARIARADDFSSRHFEKMSMLGRKRNAAELAAFSFVAMSIPRRASQSTQRLE
jgi:hypothetical protein